MIDLLVELMLTLIQCFLGSIFIKGAIDFYHKGDYFWCGFNLFGAFYIALQIVKIVFRIGG